MDEDKSEMELHPQHGDMFPSQFVSTPELIKELKNMRRLLNDAYTQLNQELPTERLEKIKHLIHPSGGMTVKLGLSGPSGAGKSTILNALLQVKDIIPAGGLGKACTPVPIEIAYNRNPDLPFKAVIDYIPEEAWIEEIAQAQNVEKKVEDPDRDSQVLMDKVEAVYPRIFSDAQKKSMTAREIINSDPDIKRLLSSRTIIQESDAEAFRQQFRSLLVPPSRERETKPQSWPLIQNVKLFLQSEILQGGLRLVDIPGVNDSCRARGGKAKQYLATCSAVCIVGDSLRIGSEAAFSNHLEEVLSTMLFGNRADKLILISTKIDSYPSNVHLDFNDKTMTQLFEAKENYQQKARKAQDLFELYEEGLDKKVAELQRVKKELKKWKQRSTKISNGYEVRETSKSKKVKGELISQEDADSQVDYYENEVERTADEVEKAELAMDKKKEALEQANISAKQKLAKYNRALHNHIIQTSQENLLRVYDRRRNAVLRDLQSDSETDEKSLVRCPLRPPAFSVSGQTFQALQGLADTRSNGQVSASGLFTDVESTGIPDLAMHLKKVFNSAQYEVLNRNCQEMLAEVRSLELYLLNTFECRPVDQRIASQAIKEAEAHLKICGADLASVIDAREKAMIGDIKSRFERKIPHYADAAVKILVDKKMIKWTLDKSTHKGWLCYQEYKAAIIRQGVWSGVKNQNINFNKIVERKIQSELSSCFVGLFSHTNATVNVEMRTLEAAVLHFFDELHVAVRSKAKAAGVTDQAINSIDEQIKLRRTLANHLTESAQIQLQQANAEPGINLDIEVKNLWRKGYDAAESCSGGKGALFMMNDAMRMHLKKDKVIKKVLEDLNIRLQLQIKVLMAKLKQDLLDLVADMVKDYQAALRKRAENAMVVHDPKVNELRSRMVVLGYASCCKKEDGTDAAAVTRNLKRRRDSADDPEHFVRKLEYAVNSSDYVDPIESGETHFENEKELSDAELAV